MDLARSWVLRVFRTMNLSKPSFASWCIWHGLAVVAIVLIPIRLEFDVIWNLGPDSRALATGVAIAYLASVAALTFICRHRSEVRLSDLLCDVRSGVCGSHPVSGDASPGELVPSADDASLVPAGWHLCGGAPRPEETAPAENCLPCAPSDDREQPSAERHAFRRAQRSAEGHQDECVQPRRHVLRQWNGCAGDRRGYLAIWRHAPPGDRRWKALHIHAQRRDRGAGDPAAPTRRPAQQGRFPSRHRGQSDSGTRLPDGRHPGARCG